MGGKKARMMEGRKAKGKIKGRGGRKRGYKNKRVVGKKARKRERKEKKKDENCLVRYLEREMNEKT